MNKPPVIMAGAIVLMVFALGWVVGNRYFSEEMQSARIRSDQLEAASQALEEQRKELIRLRTGAEVDADALEKLRQTVARLDEKSTAQREELMLYGKLLDLKADDEGIQILQAGVARGEEALSYTYSFVVRQQAATLKRIKVVYTLRVDGVQQAEEKSYDLAALDPAVDSDALDTQLKYFRVIEGEIRLPEQFLPKTLTISAWPAGAPQQRRDLKLDWPAVGGQ